MLTLELNVELPSIMAAAAGVVTAADELRSISTREAILEAVATIAGDAIHNLRSALDILV